MRYDKCVRGMWKNRWKFYVCPFSRFPVSAFRRVRRKLASGTNPFSTVKNDYPNEQPHKTFLDSFDLNMAKKRWTRKLPKNDVTTVTSWLENAVRHQREKGRTELGRIFQSYRFPPGEAGPLKDHGIFCCFYALIGTLEKNASKIDVSRLLRHRKYSMLINNAELWKFCAWLYNARIINGWLPILD